MNTNFAQEKALLVAQWRKEGKTGSPSDEDVILFAERRWNAAYFAWVAESEAA